VVITVVGGVVLGVGKATVATNSRRGAVLWSTFKDKPPINKTFVEAGAVIKMLEELMLVM